MRKSAEACRTISEVAPDLDVPKHVLRFWEIKFPQIRPMKRGGGRRYYRPEDVELLSGIRALLHNDGYTIKGVQKILKEQGPEYAKSYGRGDAPGGPEIQKSVVAKKAGRSSNRAAIKRGKAKTPDVVMSAEHRNILTKAIAELEECRRQLASALPVKAKTKAPAKKRSNAAAR